MASTKLEASNRDARDQASPEVLERPRRRSFTAAYRMSILAEADGCRGDGDVGAMLRREGLYSSHLTEWRRQRELGLLRAVGPSRGRKPKSSAVEKENARLRQRLERVEKELETARKVVDIQKSLSALAGDVLRERRAEVDAVKREGLRDLVPVVGTAAACDVVGVSRATHYRHQRPKVVTPPGSRPRPARAVSQEERAKVLEVLHSERFADRSPAEVYSTLLDDGTYLVSERTMYRILEAAHEVRERRAQLRHPAYHKPELLATGPNQAWSWDITRLLGPAKWTYFYLYVILDIYSRYVVGWMIAHRESTELARRLIADTIAKQGIAPGTLVLHADRGSSMKSKPVALLLADLGVTKSHSRPHVSNDNPYSEAQFRTLKYWPSFPERFGCAQDAREFCCRFFPWYNDEHRHSGVGYLTPATVHHGGAQAAHAARAITLQMAYATHPERFVRGLPHPPDLPTEAWINKPSPSQEVLQ
ncbi:MAG: IS3 family transposase [Candidatus Dormibacteria bacterium]